MMVTVVEKNANEAMMMIVVGSGIVCIGQESEVRSHPASSSNLASIEVKVFTYN
jgi:hypothetical protein